MMDNRKYYNTPRDRIDDNLLRQLLKEAEPCPSCSPNGTAYSRSPYPRQVRPASAASGQNPAPRCSDGDLPLPDPVLETPDTEGIRNPCRKDGRLNGFPLAMVYAPDQEWQNLYEEDDTLDRGTLFRSLDYPFLPGCRPENRRSCGCGE